MLVKVTQDHIKLGKRFNADNCPVSLALLDATGKSYKVDYGRAYYNSDFIQCDKDILLPDHVTRFISRFDSQEKSCEPFEFEVPDVN